MTNEKIKEEMIEIETVQIAVNDKLHRIQEDHTKIISIQNNIQIRIDTLKKELEKCG